MMLTIVSCKTSKTPPDNAIEDLGPNPYIEIDELPVDKSEIGKYNPADIVLLTTYYNSDATSKFGEKASDGAVIIETRAYATNKFETFLKSYSNEYQQMMMVTKREDIQYILNGRILTGNFEGDLSLLNDKLLKALKIVDKDDLIKKFDIHDKKIGVILKADRPRNVYNSKAKF